MTALLKEDILGVYNGFMSHIYDRVDMDHDVNITPYPYDCAGCYRMDFCTKIGRGFWDMVRVSDDILACISKNNYSKDFNLSYGIDQDHYVFRFLISGDVYISHEGGEKVRVPEHRISMHRVHKGEQLTLSYKRGSQLAAISLFVSMRYMEELCRFLTPECRDDFHAQVDQNRGPDQSRGEFIYDIELDPHVRSQILDIHTNNYTGELRHFFIKAKTNELLCSIIQKFRDQEEGECKEVLGESEKVKLRQAFEILEKNFSEPPSMKDISKHVGLNRTKLRQGFHALYGKTLFDHCLDRRMQEACELLRNRSMNITQISQGLGYGHSTNFTASFKKYFGILPKDYRKNAH